METFLKWAGGKRWLLTKSDELLPDMTKIKRYIEPFLGGGSMFFHIEPKVALLSDINADLINAYSVVRDNWSDLYDILRKYNNQHSRDFYYKIRSSKPRTPISKAARFIYLNRTCWNGLYRVNKKGEFNVPIGSKSSVVSEDDNFEKLSSLLKKASLEVCDFEVTIDKAEKNDFLFIDPPYTVKHNLNGFVKYNETIFSWEDQIRLRNSVSNAISKGVKVLITNANHSSIEQLYEGCGNMRLLNRASVIAGKKTARGVFSELAITNW
jgi:DNA adenine methylase